MHTPSIAAFLALLLTVSIHVTASAQNPTPKELKTKVGRPTILVQLVTPKPDCSALPGPSALPVITRNPANGAALLQVVIVDVAATGACGSRKVPGIAVIYSPKKDFEGSDIVEMEVQMENRTARLAYRITVAADPI